MYSVGTIRSGWTGPVVEKEKISYRIRKNQLVVTGIDVYSR